MTARESGETHLDVIKENWRQGHILPREAHDEISRVIGELNPDAVCIVITHSCDLVRPDTLSYVEIVIGNPTGKPLDGNYAYARSRKCIELMVADESGEHAYRVTAEDRAQLPIELLAKYVPDSVRHLVSNDYRMSLIEWLVARYARPGLPDGFEARIYPIRKKLAKAAKKLGDVWRVYIGLTPWDNQIPESQEYKVELKFVMRAEDYEDVEKRMIVLKSIEEFLKALAEGKGLKVPTDPVEVLCTDDELTLYHERHLKRWEKYDYISLADSEHIGGQSGM